MELLDWQTPDGSQCNVAIDKNHKPRRTGPLRVKERQVSAMPAVSASCNVSSPIGTGTGLASVRSGMPRKPTYPYAARSSRCETVSSHGIAGSSACEQSSHPTACRISVGDGTGPLLPKRRWRYCLTCSLVGAWYVPMSIACFKVRRTCAAISVPGASAWR